MYGRDQIIEKLGIQDWDEMQQNEAVEMATLRIGDAFIQGLSEAQLNEYEAIVNDHTQVIDAWLSQNVPDYKESPVYQEFEAGYEDDPEKNSPAKLFASIAWMQLNAPNAQPVIDAALAEYKQELQAAA